MRFRVGWIILIFLAIGVLSLMAIMKWQAYNRVRAFQSTPIQFTSFKTGDLILTKGCSWQSSLVRIWDDSQSEYSHLGIVIVVGDTMNVLHATPTCLDHPEGGVVLSALTSFLGPEEIYGYSLYRAKHESSEHLSDFLGEKAAFFQANYHPFDHDFDLETDLELYCTELVWKLYTSAGIDLWGRLLNEKQDILMPIDLVLMGKGLDLIYDRDY